MKNLFARSTQIAGVLFVISAVLSLATAGSFAGIVSIAGFVAAAVFMFTRNRSVAAASGSALLTLSAFISLLNVLKFGNIFIFVNLLNTLAYGGLTIAFLCGMTNYVDKYADTIKKLWYLPAVIRLLALVVTFSAYTGYYYGFAFKFFMVIGGLMASAAVLFATVWALFPERIPEVVKTEAENQGYIGLVKHILLLFLTFGIWYLIWLFRTTKFLNRVEDEEPRKPVAELLLCMFIPFYTIFWNWKSVLRVIKLDEQDPMFKALIMCLSVICPILVPIFLQDAINHMVMKSVPAEPVIAEPEYTDIAFEETVREEPVYEQVVEAETVYAEQ